MTQKKIKNKNSLFIVVAEDENKFFRDFELAVDSAKILLARTGLGVEIYEVSKAWSLDVPDEPEPELSEIPLEEAETED